MKLGPWAARFYAATLYAQEPGYLPSGWYWAAQSLNVRAPPLFDGAFGSVREQSSAVPLSSRRESADKNPKFEVNLSAGVFPSE